jgi:hypothetical protein
MKVVKIFSIALVSSFLLVSATFAKDIDNVGSDLKAAENSVREQLAGVLSGVSTDETEIVNVYFSISAKGFEVNAVTGENEELISKVKGILTSKDLAVPALLNGKYHIKVRFVNGAYL